ncbi:MAG: porin [Planctomycetaceae bacterium]|jgi:hypothetical protein|nr:porin [Planctomycetaceae bacterium]
MPTAARSAFAALALLAAPAVGLAQEPATAGYDEALRKLQADFERRIAELEKKIAEQPSPKATIEQALKGKWYEKIGLRGYTQFRYTTLFNKDMTPDLVVGNDSTVTEQDTFGIRRGRFIFSGNVTEHVYLYAQLDMFGTVGGAGDKGLQNRDLYADVAFDTDKEYRLRLGQSKVPFGFVNLQSSQNRAAMERPEALNSAVEGERDLGVYFMWAPKEIRTLFSDLIKRGLKGSGDYGVVAIGAYSGQGLNRSDRNGEAHWIARASYPWQFDNGQILELGIQAYTGDFVVNTSGAVTAKADGIDDERAGLTAVLYPQPFGFESEWVWGRGPELNGAGTAVGRKSLDGGYVQFNYALETPKGNVFPFVRWNYYDGGRKFATNAPRDEVSELDLGFEWSPWPELEVAVMYTHTFHRTNTRSAPYSDTEDEDRIGFQVQWNY